MNREVAGIVEIYATKSERELHEYLLGKSKHNLMAALIDLLTMYMNDKNSSTLREFVTVSLADYTHTEYKVGYNGYRLTTYGKPIKCEAKPQNVRRDGKRKLNGGGNFTDYTHERLRRDLEENLNVLVSGFVDGRLLYVLEFPFNCPSFVSKLRKQLEKRFPEGDVPGQFLRSARFSYRDYVGCEDLRVVFCLPKSRLEEYRSNIVRGFYNFLQEVAPDD